MLYIPANDNVCAYVIGQEVEYRQGRQFIGNDWDEFKLVLADGAENYIGELQAWNVDTGKKVWSKTFKSQNWGPVLATGGDLIFMGGTNDRFFRAFHAKTGQLLWQQRTNSGVTGVPTSYEVNGRQYIAVLSGWGVDAEREQALLAEIGKKFPAVPQGGVLWVFGLD